MTPEQKVAQRMVSAEQTVVELTIRLGDLALALESIRDNSTDDEAVSIARHALSLEEHPAVLDDTDGGEFAYVRADLAPTAAAAVRLYNEKFGTELCNFRDGGVVGMFPSPKDPERYEESRVGPGEVYYRKVLFV